MVGQNACPRQPKRSSKQRTNHLIPSPITRMTVRPNPATVCRLSRVRCLLIQFTRTLRRIDTFLFLHNRSRTGKAFCTRPRRVTPRSPRLPTSPALRPVKPAPRSTPCLVTSRRTSIRSGDTKPAAATRGTSLPGSLARTRTRARFAMGTASLRGASGEPARLPTVVYSTRARVFQDWSTPRCRSDALSPPRPRARSR